MVLLELEGSSLHFSVFLFSKCFSGIDTRACVLATGACLDSESEIYTHTYKYEF